MVLTNEELQVLVHQLGRIATALEQRVAQTKHLTEVIDRLIDVVGSTEDGRWFIRTRRK